MHKPGRWILTTGTIGLVTLAVFLALRSYERSLGSPHLASWITSQSPRSGLRLPGVVEAQEVRLGSKVGGRVETVHVEEGALVNPGVSLVTFEAPELRAQWDQWQARLKSDEAELEKARNGPRKEEIAAARAAVGAAEERWKRTQRGYRQEEIRQAQSDWDSAQADLKLAEEELRRTEQLYRERTVPQAELDSARANLDLLEAGTRGEEIAELEAKVAETHGKLRELKANLAETVVRAPSRSVIDVIAVRKGDLVPAGQTVVRALSAADLWVKIFVPETDLARVRLNQGVAVEVDGYPDRRFQGRVTFIASQSEFLPRNVQTIDERRHQVFGAKVRVADPQGVFKSGMAAFVTLSLDPARGE
jgi:multidrug resistance efflux pump